MPARAIASLSLSFGLVSIPVKLYSATESSAAIKFKLLGRHGARLRQQYVADEAPVPAAASSPAPVTAPVTAPEPAPVAGTTPIRAAARSGRTAMPPAEPEADVEPDVEPDVEFGPEVESPHVVARSEMVKGYEFEKGRFVLFSDDELKALAEGARQTIDIVSFIPEHAVDPLYYDKAYLLAPDRKGAKPYSLLLRALRESGRTALAKWAWRAKEYVVQVRAAEGGLVLQQLLYADEVRSLDQLDIELAPVGEAELELALRLVEQSAETAYDPSRFVDEEKQRLLAAIEQKIAGGKVVGHDERPAAPSAQVIDLVEALRASLRSGPLAPPASVKATVTAKATATERKPVRRAAPVAAKTADASPPRALARRK